jgi:hypothetical protein
LRPARVSVAKAPAPDGTAGKNGEGSGGRNG